MLVFSKAHARADLGSRDFLDRVAPGDVIEPAIEYLQRALSKALDGKVSTRVLRNPQGKLAPYIVPNNLLGALWLQFAHAFGRKQEKSM
ncbi:MAG: hypothetical protein H0V34_00425 [Gammaproteobacteria bacterium]|nr:hypothetical protein [Gammaproteobacteria bacterium]